MNVQRLLLALDLHRDGRTLTAGSCAAADQALELATALGASVVLLHSTAADEAWDGEQGRYVEVSESAPETRRPPLEEVAERFRAAGVDAAVATSDEKAWLAILRRVVRDSIDLVVAGKRNEERRGSQPLGSVSSKLLRKCPCAVWVAKPGSDAAPGCVLAASDLSPVGERVLEYAAFVASHFGAALHVVHAFQLPLSVQMAGETQIAEFDRREREERTRALEAQVPGGADLASLAFHVGRTSPTRAILDGVERLEPDLVVMGTVSRGGIAGLLLGNTAERLLGQLDVSLLAVKPADFECPVRLEE